MTTKALAPVPKTSLTREVVERLRRAILTGELAAGQRIPEAATAAKLGVSRVPVREALVELEKEGLIAFDPRGRGEVRDFTDDDYDEIASLRTALQTLGVKLAAVKLAAEDIERLEALVARARKTQDASEFSRLDIAFHEEIVAIARHRRLQQCWNSLRSQMELWLVRVQREQDTSAKGVRERTLRAHRELIAVLKSGDPERAAERMERHCNRLRERHPFPA